MPVDLERKYLSHSVHNSERMSYRGCKRRWSWIFRDGYYPLSTAPPLEFGVAYHKAMETYYEPLTWELMHSSPQGKATVEQHAVNKFHDINDKQFGRAFNSGLYSGDQLDELKVMYKERSELGEGMLRYYFSYAPSMDNFKPVRVEISFELPLTDPDTSEQMYCKCQNCWLTYAKNRLPTMVPDDIYTFYQNWIGLPVTFGGRADALMEDEYGQYWLFDWKTAATIRDDDRFLDTDDQITGYCTAFYRLGVPVRGFIYHEQRKAFPIPPTENKSTRLGCRYSKNKQQATSYDLYLTTVKEHDTLAFKEGLYDDMLDYLQSEGIVFSKRKEVLRSKKELDNAYDYMCREARRMITETETYPEPGRFNCSNCAFREPCISRNQGADYLYTLNSLFEVREPYWVQNEELSSDKRYRG